jgi:hypothetical protein
LCAFIVAAGSFYLNNCTKKPPAVVLTQPSVDTGALSGPRVDTSKLAPGDNIPGDFSRTISSMPPVQTDTSIPIKGILIKQYLNPDFVKHGQIEFRIGNSTRGVEPRTFLNAINLFTLNLVQASCPVAIMAGVADARLYLSMTFYDALEPHDKVGSLKYNRWELIPSKVYPRLKNTDSSLVVVDSHGYTMISLLYHDQGINNCKIEIDGYIVDPAYKIINLFSPTSYFMCQPFSEKRAIDSALAHLIDK